jgi:hypothetical protein
MRNFLDHLFGGKAKEVARQTPRPTAVETAGTHQAELLRLHRIPDEQVGLMLERTGIWPHSLAGWYDSETYDFRAVPLYIRTHFRSHLNGLLYENRRLYLSPEIYLHKKGLKTLEFPDRSIVLVDKGQQTLDELRRLTEQSEEEYLYLGLVPGVWVEVFIPEADRMAAYFNCHYRPVGFACGQGRGVLDGYDYRIQGDVARDLLNMASEREVGVDDLDRAGEFSLPRILKNNLRSPIMTCQYSGPYKRRWNTTTVDYDAGQVVLASRQPPRVSPRLG